MSTLTTLLNIFLERIMTDALEDHEGTVSNGGRSITNFRFSDDIDGLAGEEVELAKLVECHDKTSTSYGMEISAEKTMLMTNNTSGINFEIKVNGQKRETFTCFKHLGSVITDEVSKPNILSRIAQATAALTRWKPVLNDGSISLSSKIRLMCSLASSIFLCMLVNHGPSQQAPKTTTGHGNEVLPQDTTHRMQTLLPTRKSVP